ncbi:caspase family protein [Bradyrhizobium huanghuaihaiense]|uniref:caspase family protein n=1 Tax=Bradyrhizobium huanghuaihaiense TaxID=990078 RepID=UPI0021AA52EF|nr:caspase family protein [Bradyrhizobium sp. CB3035]UWU80045.1 caspase family protein [Bradyrhizobium sp. CB3035]
MTHTVRTSSFVLGALFLVLGICLGSSPCLAEKRVALVIGNSAYKSVAKLANPANDAGLIGGMLKKAGFDTVDVRQDLSAPEMRKALREFSARTRDADVAVIYYAGHGLELDGTNYLIPTDAALEADTDVYDEALPIDRVLVSIEPAKQLRLVILDACRDNPFSKTMKRTVASRAVGRGLAKVEPTSPNTMIAFAAKAGSTASDGDSRNSPFAVALSDHLPKPGLDLRKAFGFVRDDVLKATGYKQEPYVYGSLGGDDVPLVPAKPAVIAGPQANPQDSVRRDYELALQAGLREAWEAFLQTYPDGFYANLARVQLKKIAAEEERAQATEKARLAEQEKVKLAAERAQKAELEKAAAAAKAAEDARIAAEKQKQIEQAKAEAAERERKVAEAAAAKALAEKQAAEKAKAEAAAKQAADKQAADAESKKVAALSPLSSSPPPGDLSKSVQLELRRVGCMKTEPTGEWSETAQRSLSLFNKYAGTKFDAKLANTDVFDALKAKSGRVCPLVCDHGFRADGDACTKIVCRPGYRVSDDNECEKIQEKKPVATREDSRKRDADRKATEAAPSKPQVAGQIICTAGGGCRPVRKGCRLDSHSGGVGQVEVCN